MRIMLLITSFAPGGAEILCRGLAKAFTKAGHRCLVTAICDAATVGNSPEFEQAFKQELLDHGIGIAVLGNNARTNPLVGAARLRSIVRDFAPDVLHIHSANGLLFQALGLLRKPTIYTHHNIRLNFPAFLFSIFDRFVDRYVAISSPCEALLRRHVSRPIISIPNGVADDFALESHRLLPQDPIVLSVGTITAQKDYSTLVRAAALCAHQLREKGRRVRFQIAGGGDVRELRDLIAEEGLEDHVELLGTRSDIPALMARADVLANSSIYEGLPITLIEAAMAGLPAVATNVGGNGEVVRHGINGLLVPPGQPDALAAALIELLSDPTKYEGMCASARSLSEKFSLGKCVEAHLKLYSSVLS